MKKLILMLCFALLFSGCTSSVKSDETTERMNRYEAYYNSILDNERFVEETDYFDVEVVMNQLADGTYRYDIIIDNPTTAMYDVQAVVVENDTIYTQMQNMSPSFGILDSSGYAMIPNQVARDLGYVKGIVLSGVAEEPEVSLKLVVLWKDSGKIDQKRVYMQLKGVYGENRSETDGQTQQDEVDFESEESADDNEQQE